MVVSRCIVSVVPLMRMCCADSEHILHNLTHAICQVNINEESVSDKVTPTMEPAHALLISLVVLRVVERVAAFHVNKALCNGLFESLIHLQLRAFGMEHETGASPHAIYRERQAQKILETLMKLFIDSVGEHDLVVLDKLPKPQFDLSLPLPRLWEKYVQWSTPSEGKQSLIPDDFVWILARITHHHRLEPLYGKEDPSGYFYDAYLGLGVLKSPRYEALYRMQHEDSTQGHGIHSASEDGESVVIDAGATIGAVPAAADVEWPDAVESML